MKTVSLLFTGVLIALMMSAGTVNVERATVRSGPGAFFPAIAEVQKGYQFNILEDGEAWIKVQVEEQQGYLSRRAMEATGGRGQARSVTDAASGRRVDFSVSATGVSAAVRGFSDQYAAHLKSDQNVLAYLKEFPLDPNAYLRFKRETYSEIRQDRFQRWHRLPRIRHEMLYYPVDEEGAGYAIAAHIASEGIYENRALQEYINNVGFLLVEASHAYDLGFRFFVMNSEEVKAYATPGGTVFISIGMLRMLRNEAELAAVLAHELAHITLRHGLTEMDIREPLSRAADAFSQLDQLMQRTEEQQRVVSELNQAYLDYQHRLYSPRTNEYEYEADEMALIYMARAGYSPQALHNVVLRLLNDAERDTYPYVVGEIEMRYEELAKALRAGRWRDQSTYFFHQRRFESVMSHSLPRR